MFMISQYRWAYVFVDRPKSMKLYLHLELKVEKRYDMVSCFSGLIVHQSRLPPTVQSCASGETVATGLHHTDPAVDVHPVLQGTALRLSLIGSTLLHLRDYWNASRLTAWLF